MVFFSEYNVGYFSQITGKGLTSWRPNSVVYTDIIAPESLERKDRREKLPRLVEDHRHVKDDFVVEVRMGRSSLRDPFDAE